MRIGICGSQNTGKSTLIKDIISKWGMYTTPELTYRDLLTEKNLPCNQKTTVDTQQAIMDLLTDQIVRTTSDDMVIFDRTPHDCLVYSLYQNIRGIDGFDDEFIKKQILLAREASKFLDIIFYIPIIEKYDIPLVDDALRDTNPEYRKEIDNIFAEVFSTNEDGLSPFFYADDRPAVIEIFGNREERIKMIELYLNEAGKAFGEEDSLIADDIYIPDEYKDMLSDSIIDK